MRTLAIGDIHGGLQALIQIVERAKITPDDQLIFVGDYVDGWSESAQVIQYLIELSKTNECIFIKGNHDVWCEQWLAFGDINDVWYQHGGKETIESYNSFSKDDKQKHLDFFEAMPLYHLDEKHRLFLHAGFTSMHGVEKEVNKQIFYYDRTLWEMALTMDKRIDKDSVIYPNRLKHYKEIYIGHTPTINFGKMEPMNAINVWNVDTGAAFTGKVSAIDIETKEVFQSDALPMLYPNEMGRNKR
ncbi:serine/threonine protein phosphatase [Winogradskyella echinorum]|uniref:Serine/threonine protein phosphatase n=1 Tax=Winogradskyella echinorum TaxID=538189 RepID=A0ABR6XXT8_9FLAO|nr:metallophosphoesterase family protein [Winogradskyella echinorum]MBC3845293.1 serine/threonine protein phosphatase [Winogradskyella echinorum]MBC5749641.1 serine/threonine protein phosphatase [Winogradskyella echinorum]